MNTQMAPDLAEVGQLIRQNSLGFHSSSTMADDLTRRQYTGLPWDQFPAKTGTIEQLHLLKGDQFYGTIYIATADGKTFERDMTQNGSGFTLAALPAAFVDAARYAIVTDKSIDGANVRCLMGLQPRA